MGEIPIRGDCVSESKEVWGPNGSIGGAVDEFGYSETTALWCQELNLVILEQHMIQWNE